MLTVLWHDGAVVVRHGKGQADEIKVKEHRNSLQARLTVCSGVSYRPCSNMTSMHENPESLPNNLMNIYRTITEDVYSTTLRHTRTLTE